MSEGIRPELMLNDGRWDIGRLIGDELVARFGFEAEPDWDGVFQRVVDSQHAVIVTIGDWGRVPGGGSTMPSPRFGVARRDINELWNNLLDDRVRRWRRTVREHPWFFGREPVSFLTSRDEPVDVTRWMDELIPRLVAETPHWSLRAAGRSDLSRSVALRADDVVTSPLSENAFWIRSL